MGRAQRRARERAQRQHKERREGQKTKGDRFARERNRFALSDFIRTNADGREWAARGGRGVLDGNRL